MPEQTLVCEPIHSIVPGVLEMVLHLTGAEGLLYASIKLMSRSGMTIWL